MKEEKDVLILALETSCDETAAAVVRNGREPLSNVISSQIKWHKVYGGVVPEIASRKHMEKINQVIEEALYEANTSLEEMDAIAVTYGPGLVGALLVGVSTAKAISYAVGKPLIGVHHIKGHICANYIEHADLTPSYLCLVVSGGHTHLVKATDYISYEIIGRTRDDAAGEAFDKVARVLGLEYPGGPALENLARSGNPNAIAFPRAKVAENPYDFSFSGIKSAVLNYINASERKEKPSAAYAKKEPMGSMCGKADIAASFQQAVIDVLIERSLMAVEEYGMDCFALAGGVASNGALRGQMKRALEEKGIRFYCPSPLLCTDNAAMIGAAAYYEYAAGRRDAWDLNAVPNLALGNR